MRIILLSILLVLSGWHPCWSQPAIDVINQMQLQSSKVRTLEFTMQMNERFDGKMLKTISFFKIQNKPFKVYMKQSTPQKGLEVLLVAGKYDNKAWVNTNGFPWVTLHLDPNSWTMRDGHHHSIYHSGFSYVLEVLGHLMKEFDTQAAGMVTNEGLVTIEGRKCYKVRFRNPVFKSLTYTVQPGDNLLTIAQKRMINEYMILEMNPGVDNFTDVSAGQKITIPSHYASEIVLQIDAQTYLPYSVHIYDTKGLFQEYYYLNLKTNVNFREADFDPENPEYKF